jgi:hypothetical protein
MALALAANVALWRVPFYRALLAVQIAFYVLALVGQATRSKSRIFALPAGFVFLNAATVRAFWHFLAGKNLHHWQAPPGEKH